MVWRRLAGRHSSEVESAVRKSFGKSLAQLNLTEAMSDSRTFEPGPDVFRVLNIEI
jgi:hypothetical protein